MDYDHKLTILLLLKDRFQLTWRWMSYADKICLPFQVLIADGSSNDKTRDLLSDESAFSNVNYEYQRYPYDETLSHFYNKTVDALSQVTTPYVLLASNDDFLLVEGLRRAIAFLEDNTDYISARGEVYDFSIRQTDFFDHGMQYVFGPLVIERVQPYFKQFSMTSDDPLERICQQLKYNVSHFYNVHRTVSLQERFQLIKKMDIKDLRLADQCNDILTAVEGKAHQGKGLFMLYQHNAPEKEGQKVVDKYSNLSEWMQSPSWQLDFRNLTETVANAIVESCDVSLEEIKERFKRYYYELYVTRLLNDTKKIDQPNGPKKVLKWVERRTKNGRLHRLLHFLYRGICMPNDYIRLRSSKYFEEIKFIRDFVSILSFSSKSHYRYMTEQK